jgi:SNF2 family DNA or RNA helicase
MTAAADMMDISYDYSLEKYLQSRDRIHRPGQTRPVSYFDVIATGPSGQKTIDHHVIKARREKHNIAEWTTRAWIRALQEE